MLAFTSRRALAIALCTLLAACAGTDAPAARVMAQYEAACEKQGHAPGSDAWRACVQTEELNAALATQRSYDDKALRRLDCFDPRIGCAPPR